MRELATKTDVPAATADLEAAIERVEASIERLVRQLTVRWGIMLAVGFGGLAAFLKLT
jgi:hypothetical protein